MKRIIPISILSSIALILFTSAFMSDNGRAGATGAPGETTCNTTNCHNTYASNSGGGSITATSSMNNWTYDPLATYTFSVKVARTGNHLFGVGVGILTAVNNNGGTLNITDPMHTQIKTRTISGVTRRNVVHTLNGGSSQDSMIFTFSWTAPDTTAGPLTMYFAGDATNANGQPSGDYVYTGNQVISPSSGNAISEVSYTNPLNIYPNPASDFINVQFNLPKSENVEIKLYDLAGRMSWSLTKNELSAGENNIIVKLPENLSKGIYMIRLESSSANIFRKIMIN